MKNKNAPIGIFDSGIGGLTVASQIISRMPGENIIYLGDTARVPYGVRSPDTIRRYAAEGAAFLFDKGIKLLVVACNTMSAVCLDEMARSTKVPVIGVIEPGARAAVKVEGARNIGVIGTEATIASGAYVRAIHEAGDSLEVVAQACPLFVPLAEEGWTDGEVPRLAAQRYLSDMKDGAVDALVLGCTHYPLLSDVLLDVMGPGTSIIDSATETALMVENTLAAKAMENPAEDSGEVVFYVTDGPEKFKSVGERFLMRKIVDIRLTTLTEVT